MNNKVHTRSSTYISHKEFCIELIKVENISDKYEEISTKETPFLESPLQMYPIHELSCMVELIKIRRNKESTTKEIKAKKLRDLILKEFPLSKASQDSVKNNPLKNINKIFFKTVENISNKKYSISRNAKSAKKYNKKKKPSQGKSFFLKPSKEIIYRSASFDI